jgi:TRAP-type C4-dicarboxylate transport system permease small subunit
MRGSALLSGWLLGLIMLLTFVDVAVRTAGAPLYGTQEVTELAMVALIMLALPYCTATDGHVRVDVFDSLLGMAGRRIADAVIFLVSVVVLSFLIYNTALKALDTFRYADATNLLAVPLWPVYALIAVSMSAYLLVILRARFWLPRRSAQADV